MKQFVLILAIVALAAVPALAQGHGSDRGEATLALDNGKVTVEYGRPVLKGRDLGAMLQPGFEWRLGSNAATTLTTTVPLKFGAAKVEPGTYVLRARYDEQKAWHLVFYKPGQMSAKIAEVPLTFATVADSAESLTMALERAGKGGKIMVHWGTLALSAGFEPA